MSLPVYESIRDGPSHAASFKASVTINAQTFESTEFSHTVKEAEQAAAKIALETLAQGPLDVSTLYFLKLSMGALSLFMIQLDS